MAIGRIRLIDAGDELDVAARSALDRIVESRGRLDPPFQVLLHSPAMAQAVAELGHVVRFGSHLADTDRELVTLATGLATGCSFVWTSHLKHAAAAGIDAETLTALEGDRGALGERERALVAFVDELCEQDSVSGARFGEAVALLGERGVVELALTVGYYTMLARMMGACGGC